MSIENIIKNGIKTNKNILSAMLRELSEETAINVPNDVIINNLKKVEVFDNITRSERGRIITHVHMIEMISEELPKVKGSDDARNAGWYSIKELNRKNFFEDHFDIIIKMLEL